MRGTQQAQFGGAPDDATSAQGNPVDSGQSLTPATIGASSASTQERPGVNPSQAPAGIGVKLGSLRGQAASALPPQASALLRKPVARNDSHSQPAAAGRARIGWLCGLAALVLLEVLIALFVHDRFVRPYLGDMIVVWVVYCFARLFCPRRAPRLLPLWVFVFAALVELSQLWGLAARLGLADSRFFSILLGGTFDPADLLCYAVGCAVLFVLEPLARRRADKRT